MPNVRRTSQPHSGRTLLALVTLKGDNTIFADGFENQTTSNWSVTVP